MIERVRGKVPGNENDNWSQCDSLHVIIWGGGGGEGLNTLSCRYTLEPELW